MMTRICLVFCSLFLLSCSVNSKKSGGSVVGNGMIRFYNEIYDYSFLYDSRLTLTKLSTEQIYIDNSAIANRINKPTSLMEIEVSKAESLDLEGLLTYAKNKDSNTIWQPISVTGVNGVFHKIEKENRLSAQYLFLLGTTGVLSIKINASTEADGISLISPIVETLSFDTIAPVVHEMAFDPPIVKAGQTAKLRIRASDNLTEIRGQNLNSGVEIDSQKECRGLLIYSKKQIETCGDFRAIGNGWYEIDVPTNPRMEGFAKLKVTNNSEVDLEGPKFLEAKPDKTEYRPGESGSILFKIVDDLSGVTRTKGREFSDRCDIGIVRQEYDNDDKNDYRRIPLCDGEFRHVEGDWYAIDFKLGVKIPTGEYWFPSFEVQDHVGNSTYLSAFNPNGIQTNYRYVFQDTISNVSVVKFRVVNN